VSQIMGLGVGLHERTLSGRYKELEWKQSLLKGLHLFVSENYLGYDLFAVDAY
jgi:hypothetical protein